MNMFVFARMLPLISAAFFIGYGHFNDAELLTALFCL